MAQSFLTNFEQISSNIHKLSIEGVSTHHHDIWQSDNTYCNTDFGEKQQNNIMKNSKKCFDGDLNCIHYAVSMLCVSMLMEQGVSYIFIYYRGHL